MTGVPTLAFDMQNAPQGPATKQAGEAKVSARFRSTESLQNAALTRGVIGRRGLHARVRQGKPQWDLQRKVRRPSEMAKPALAVVCAARRGKHGSSPAHPFVGPDRNIEIVSRAAATNAKKRARACASVSPKDPRQHGQTRARKFPKLVETDIRCPRDSCWFLRSART